ncbi:hypothetical protein HY250_00935 [Candidatus Azambacteria bacterium]|nr:hypothetical protein [Candidatus Azambacteria bacterium]
MKLNLEQKILTFFVLTLVVGGIGTAALFFPHDDKVISLAAFVVLINLSVGLLMLYTSLKQFGDAVRIAGEISKGNYDVAIPAGRGELRKLFETFAVMLAQLKRRNLNLTHRVYQTAILKEITDRISSLLDANEALEMISGSLGKIVSYSTVSYLTRDSQKKLVFKCHLEESVNRAFADDVKKRMIAAFKLLTEEDVKEEDVKSVYFGTIFDEQEKDPVRAFFNLPMVVDGKLVGIINVASQKAASYSEEETEVLYSIVSQAGATITKIKNLISEETEKSRSMLASLAEGIIMITTLQEVAVINQKAKEILGIADKANVAILDVIGALWGKLDFRSAIERVLMSRAQETFPELVVGTVFYKIVAGPVTNAKKEVIGVAFIFSDVTREKEIDKMKSEFISVTSHQLRTPLSSMKWFMEMLLGGDMGVLSEKQKGVLTDVYNSNERVIALVNDLLDVSRIESGRVAIEPTPTNLMEFFKSMLPEVAQNFAKRKQKFDFTAKSELPRVSIDPRLVWQVVSNLLTNASKYTPEGGNISLELSLEEKDVMIKVADNGYGIPEFQKHRVFEKFFRADNIIKMEGTGLGLYIARQIAEASGGKLWFESTEGKGTAFFMTLPLAGSKRVKMGENLLAPGS